MNRLDQPVPGARRSASLTATDLQYFLAVARRRCLILAAAELGVNHTTVGRHITHLEREIGHRLFDRTQQGWELTASGQALMEPAEASRPR